MVRVFPDIRYPIIPTPLADPRILQDFTTLLQDFISRKDDLCQVSSGAERTRHQILLGGKSGLTAPGTLVIKINCSPRAAD